MNRCKDKERERKREKEYVANNDDDGEKEAIRAEQSGIKRRNLTYRSFNYRSII